VTHIGLWTWQTLALAAPPWSRNYGGRVRPPTQLLVVGQGYVGLPLAMRAVDVGFDVAGFDVDERRVTGLNDGRSHVGDVAADEVAAALATGRYRAIDDPADLSPFDVAVITVPTPLTDGVPDLSYIESAAHLVGPLVRPGCTVILESTTYPGTTDELLAPILESASGLKAGVDFHVGYSPERINPGDPGVSLVTTPKVVAGLTPESASAVAAFYARLVDELVPVSTTRVAELTKLLENTFRHVNVALVNELAMHAHALGVDIWEAIEAASTKPFGFMAFAPGPGVGGHCLPIDPSYLSWRIERQLGVTSRFVDTANDVNAQMPGYVVQRVQRGLNARRQPVNGSRILVLGLAYKRNTNDGRESPADGIVRGLVDLGAEVLVHDDHVGPHAIDVTAIRVPLTAEVVESCDAIVVVTDHDDVDYDLVVRHARYVFDSRNRLRGEHVERL
jgi:UDP-N-acetyl-D-glucosamine dehydrogenase